MHAYNPSTKTGGWGTGGLWVQGQPGLYSETAVSNHPSPLKNFSTNVRKWFGLTWWFSIHPWKTGSLTLCLGGNTGVHFILVIDEKDNNWSIPSQEHPPIHWGGDSPCIQTLPGTDRWPCDLLTEAIFSSTNVTLDQKPQTHKPAPQSHRGTLTETLSKPQNKEPPCPAWLVHLPPLAWLHLNHHVEQNPKSANHRIPHSWSAQPEPPHITQHKLRCNQKSFPAPSSFSVPAWSPGDH
jgi:hypothetical protein